MGLGSRKWAKAYAFLNMQCDFCLIWVLVCDKGRWEVMSLKQDFQVPLRTALQPLPGPSKEKIFPEANRPADFGAKLTLEGVDWKGGRQQPKPWTVCPVTCDMGVSRCAYVTVKIPSLFGYIWRILPCSLTIRWPKKSGADLLSFSEAQPSGTYLF